MEYREALAEAQRLDSVIEEAESAAEEAKWDRAKLAWEQVQAGVSIRQWARDTSKHHETIRDWVQMWTRWGGGGHRRPTFTEAAKIISGDAAGVEEHGSLYASRARTAVRNMPPEQKAEIVRELLAEADPATAADIIERTEHERPEVHHELTNRQVPEGVRPLPPYDPDPLGSRGLHRMPDEPADVQTEALAEIQENIHAIKIAYRRIHDLLADAPLDSADREQVSANLTECQRWADLTFRQAAGSASDAEFRALLEEGV